MTIQDAGTAALIEPNPRITASPSRRLASALLHVLDRDESMPARWRSAAFGRSVAHARQALSPLDTIAALDLASAHLAVDSFARAVGVLAADPLAAAIAIRHLEVERHDPLPGWPLILRRGVRRHIDAAEASRWFG